MAISQNGPRASSLHQSDAPAGALDLAGVLEKALSDVVMVTVESASRRMRSAPMHVAQLDGDSSLWFVVPLDGQPQGEPLRGSVTGHSGTRWLQMSGRFEIVSDRDQVRAISDEMNEQGRLTIAADAEVCLLHFMPESADCWDTASVCGTYQPIDRC